MVLECFRGVIEQIRRRLRPHRVAPGGDAMMAAYRAEFRQFGPMDQPRGIDENGRYVGEPEDAVDNRLAEVGMEEEIMFFHHELAPIEEEDSFEIDELMEQGGHVEPAADTIPPAGHTIVKIMPVVKNVILPTGNKWDYEEWTTADILDWLQKFHQDRDLTDIVVQKGINGSHLYRCFLDRASSMAWCQEAKISPGTAMKIRMTLGRVHNIICGYEQYDGN